MDGVPKFFPTPSLMWSFFKFLLACVVALPRSKIYVAMNCAKITAALEIMRRSIAPILTSVIDNQNFIIEATFRRGPQQTHDVLCLYHIVHLIIY